jgi:uncharacterized protein YkwD
VRTNLSSWRRIAAAAALTLASSLLQGSLGLTTNLDARLLAAHNRERSAAGIPPLAWDAELAEGAAEWGEHLAELGDLEHSPDDPEAEPEGENLFLGTRDAYSAEAMVGAWIEEKKDFTPGIFPANSRTGDMADVGHYTQLMWRGTARVGCAVAKSDEYDVLVCRYADAGNVIGERPF